MTGANEALAKVMDAVDLETFFICQNESEAKSLMLSLFAQMGLSGGDVVFVQHEGPGARVRGRAYVHPAGEMPPYLREEEGGL
ncbi:hypothetical protein LJK88_33510 [Paenibacillus sp. P26]|nr:hypothetical protein LJK88_33510 [Paenibacillus sp. P26]UUZ93951.1 hypothetical protein LJK87_04610 [Paenibacillus sp. P25]